jgi:hypothetical protein
MELTKEDIEAEKREEHRQEYLSELRRQGLYDYISDNKSDLIKDFIQDNQELYEEFRKLYATDVATDEDFVESEESKWLDFCEEAYADCCDEIATQRSLWR